MLMLLRLVALALLVARAAPMAAQTLPEPVLNRLAQDLPPFLELAANLIHGFGTADGIDRAGVDRFVALERAATRASALRRLQLADLDFDGSITAAELQVLADAAAAKSRGRLWALMERADLDGDRVVSVAELDAFGRAEAMAGFSAMDEAIARAVLTFDGDANGRVTLEEVKAAVAALAT